MTDVNKSKALLNDTMDDRRADPPSMELGDKFKAAEILAETMFPARYWKDASGYQTGASIENDILNYLKGVGSINKEGELTSVDAEDANVIGDEGMEILDEFQFPVHEVTNPYLVIRVDGRAFHTLVRQMELDRPFDDRFIESMNAAALAVANSMQGVIMAYVQSDEISVVLKPIGDDPNWPFNGRQQKLVTTAASTASTMFALHMECLYDVDYQDSEYDDTDILRTQFGVLPTFDGRAFLLDTKEDLEDYLKWRRLDSIKNAISTVAVSEFTDEELEGKSTSERREMLESLYQDRDGHKFKIDDGLYYGRLFHKVKTIEPVRCNRSDVDAVSKMRWMKDVGDKDTVASVLAGELETIEDPELRLYGKILHIDR